MLMPTDSLLQIVQQWGNFFSAVTSLVALTISFIALFYTIRSFSRKEGAKIRATFVVQSTIASTQKHVCDLTLENMKDRSVAVYAVFLRLGHSYYVEIESFEESPLVLEPFGTYSTQYDPVDFYAASMTPIDLNELWGRNRQRIILSTSEGKYVVKERIKRWFPVSDHFRNYSNAIIHPERMRFGEKSYGSNVKFIIEVKHEDRTDEVIPIYPKDYEFRKFRDFSLTEVSLESKENLQALFEQMFEAGLLNCQSFEVWDMEAAREKAYKIYKGEIYHANHISWYEHFVLGRVHTVIDILKTRHANRQRNKNL